MDKIENFLKEPSMEKLEKLRKSEMIKIGEKLELNVENSMRKHELVIKIARHMVDENVFEEAVLEELPTEMIRMTPEEIELEKIKIQAQMELQRNKMELEKIKIQQETRLREVDLTIRGRKESHDSFEVTKQARLVPKFEEANVDEYFAHFERTALNLGWPKECWSMLLQTVLTGKAQRAYATLPTENCADYDLVKAAVLKSFELVPEAYRQKFRTQRKTENQSYVEFLREKENALDKWCDSKRIDGDAEKLRQLILAEEFLNCVPEEVRVHLSERKTDVTYEMAALADEYILTHRKTKEKPYTGSKVKFKAELRPEEENRRTFQSSSRTVVCYKCGKAGHIAIRCQLGKGPERNQTQPRKPQGAVTTRGSQSYRPWMKKGMIKGPHGGPVEVSILRDTGASQSLLLRSKLPKRVIEATRETVMIEGIGGKRVKIPLCKITLKSQWKNGPIKVGVVDKLPMKGISLILGNEIETKGCHPKKPAKMSAKNEGNKMAEGNADNGKSKMAAEPRARYNLRSCAQRGKAADEEGKLPHLGKPRDELINHQKRDESLKRLYNLIGRSKGNKFSNIYYLEDGILTRRWRSRKASMDGGQNVFRQLVMPKEYREEMLRLAHEVPMAGHLGVAKTRNKLLEHFYWPGVEKDVKTFCGSCQICQSTGKPNQKIPPAPLKPIPTAEEPFSRVLIDCVGPLPQTKAGNRYLLTLMCTTTRFPEAVPLKSITTKKVVEAMINFFVKVGLPRTIQTDKGTNFTSKLFKRVVEQLGITHIQSSAYHPQSQGALERFHSTLKNMLRAHCAEQKKDWDSGLPFVLFAARSAVQESLGFSPFELVYGRTVRGPLQIAKERWVEQGKASEDTVTYMDRLKKNISDALRLARRNLSEAQGRMKRKFDRKAKKREFKKGEEVLLLSPNRGSPFDGRYLGPYVVSQKIDERTYRIDTPEGRRKSQVCHINRLKAYIRREGQPVLAVTANSHTVEGEEGPTVKDPPLKLKNSMILRNMEEKLNHLSVSERRDLKNLIREYPGLFSDIPRKTTMIQHDVELNREAPVKQHPYRLNPRKEKLMKEEVKYMMENGIIEPSDSAWASPCVLVGKEDGSVRFCTDYRKVNAMTRADCFPIPRIEDCIDRIGRAKYITKCDLLKGYWAVPLTEKAKAISAFVIPGGTYQYRVMPFGMKNSQATFMRLMSKCLAGLEGVDAYIDDIVIYHNTWENHLETLRKVFEKLEVANLTINLAKSEFGAATVKYLGHMVGYGSVKPSEAKTQDIQKFPIPRNVRELRRFLGMAGYYRRFCKDFSGKAAPLTDLLKKKVKFGWSDRCQKAFDGIKRTLSTEPVLKAPEFEKQFHLTVDASDEGIGAVLMQEDDEGHLHPVSYYSKKLNKHQRMYATVEKELFALISSIRHFEIYITANAKCTKVYTDHNPLTFLERMRNRNRKLQAWYLNLQEYNLEVVHITGKDNVVADSLSRC